jgi:drug/metabolite transporter (DMT)-like permease
MTGASLLLVLLAALFHATWNLLAKRADAGGPEFVWLFGVLSVAIYLPVAVIVLFVSHPVLGAAQIGFIIGSGTIHTGYYTFLQRGYKEGDLSLVYPLARGTGPMLATVAAIVFFREHPTVLALVGAACICAGVFMIGSAGRHGAVRPAIAFGLITGAIIATYTLWDKHAVSALAIPAVLLDWGANVVRSAWLSPLASRRRSTVREVWQRHRREAIGVAVLSPLAYILVLVALAHSEVSYIAPTREVSILIGTVLGIRVLKEEAVGVRIAGAVAILAGVICLALG